MAASTLSRLEGSRMLAACAWSLSNLAVASSRKIAASTCAAFSDSINPRRERKLCSRLTAESLQARATACCAGVVRPSAALLVSHMGLPRWTGSLALDECLPALNDEATVLREGRPVRGW